VQYFYNEQFFGQLYPLILYMRVYPLSSVFRMSIKQFAM